MMSHVKLMTSLYELLLASASCIKLPRTPVCDEQYRDYLARPGEQTRD